MIIFEYILPSLVFGILLGEASIEDEALSSCVCLLMLLACGGVSREAVGRVLVDVELLVVFGRLRREVGGVRSSWGRLAGRGRGPGDVL